jgi:hypothetical protein
MAQIKAIACEVMREEWTAANASAIETVFLEQGLHRYPDKLRRELQAALDKMNDGDIVLLGYGLCSNAVSGIRAGTKTLVLPLVEDCISLFLGSADEYFVQFNLEPATYYFTKGWVVCRKDPYQEYLKSCERWGPEDAKWIAHETMKNYRRVAYVNTHCYDIAEYRHYARQFASFFGMRLEDLSGSLDFFREILSGKWDRCVVINPGEEISEERLREAMARSRGNKRA